MQKNVTGQKWRVFAFDATTNLPKTGDAANITAKISKDWGTKTAVDDTNPTEIEDGYYEFNITQAESNGNNLDLYPESSTANIVVIGVPGSLVTTPQYFSTMGIESDGDIKQVNNCVANTDMRGTDILSGARTITIQLYETATTTPIADVAVSVFNSDQTLFLGRETTDANGQIVIGRDDGTYKLVFVKAGVTFTVPETMVITADETKTYYGDVIDIGTPADSDACRIYDYLYLADGATEGPTQTSSVRIIELPYDKDGKLHSGDLITPVYDANTGLIYWDIVQGAKVSFFIKDYIDKERVVPALETQRLATL